MVDHGFQESLQAVLDGNADLSGFGLERSATEGIVFPDGVHEFEERLSLTGNGEIRYFLRRPVGDQGGTEVGLYQGSAKPEEIKALLKLLIDSKLDGITPAHPEPGAMCWGLAAVANGWENRFFTGTVDPQVLIPIKALRTELDKLEAKAMSAPLWTLALAAQPQPAANKGWREIALEFSNTGDEGIWIDHPAGLGSGPNGHCRLVFGEKPRLQPGVTPLPMSLKKAPLRYPAGSPSLLWVGPHATASLRAAVESPGGRSFLGRIAYVTYPGTETTAGQRRFAGGLFSADFEL